MSDKYVLEGHKAVPFHGPITEWAKTFEHNRRVEQTAVGTDVSVSTVFLGLDHSFGSGPPLIFETMIFGGPLDGEQARYSTWEEAEKGHATMVEMAMKGRVAL